MNSIYSTRSFSGCLHEEIKAINSFWIFWTHKVLYTSLEAATLFRLIRINYQLFGHQHPSVPKKWTARTNPLSVLLNWWLRVDFFKVFFGQNREFCVPKIILVSVRRNHHVYTLFFLGKDTTTLLSNLQEFKPWKAVVCIEVWCPLRVYGSLKEWPL